MTSILAQRTRRRFAVLASAGPLAVSVLAGHPHKALSQEGIAKVSQVPAVYCRYYNSQTNRNATGVATGLKSCDEGDGERLVIYFPCEGQQTQLRRKQLTRSEVDCLGVPTTPGDSVLTIAAKVLSVEGDRLTLAYEGLGGTQTFALQKNYLKGLMPKPNSSVQFFSTELTSKIGYEALAKDFEKFKFDTAQGGNPEGVVGFVMK